MRFDVRGKLFNLVDNEERSVKQVTFGCVQRRGMLACHARGNSSARAAGGWRSFFDIFLCVSSGTDMQKRAARGKAAACH